MDSIPEAHRRDGPRASVDQDSDFAGFDTQTIPRS